MTTNRLLFTLLFLCGISVFAPQAMSQPDCQSAQYIEDLNNGKLERTAHIKGDNAILFIALDPVFSDPEFDYGDHYRDEHFTEAMKSSRESLFKAGIDEVVVWRLPNRTLGVAVGFKEGCAVSGYGEPDFHKKLMLMHKAFLKISKHGLDARLAKGSIKKLLMGSRYSRLYKGEMIDIVINNLRPLIANTPPSDHSDEEKIDSTSSTDLAKQPVPGIDITGTYRSDITSDVSYWFQNKKQRKLIITLKQEGKRITGTDNIGRSELTGTIEGDTIKFNYWSGRTLKGNEVSGEWKISDDGQSFEGFWTWKGTTQGEWNLTKIE